MSEDGIRRELDAINNRLDRIEDTLTLIQEHLLSNAKQSCPNPGLCLTLSTKLENTERQTAHNAKVIEELRTWQNKMIGGSLVIFPLMSAAVTLIIKYFVG